MKLVYLTTARIPDDWAHVLQILKMCEAFADVGVNVELLAPCRAGTRTGDPYTYAGVKRNFRITKLPCIDLSATGRGKFLYWLRVLSFFLMAKIYLLFKQSDLFYTREPVAASFFRNFIFEAHDVSKRPPPRARGYVVLASGIGDAYVAKGIDPARILVSGAGVTPEEFDISLSKTEARKKLSLPPSERIIGYTGTLKTFGKEKGVRTAIQALTNVPGAVLCLVGGEPHDIEEYKLLAEKEGVMDRTMFIGKVSHDQIPIYLKAFDVGLVPLPDTEYFRLYNSPLKLFEYMAAGVPIVASDLPSIREIVNDEQAFLVVPDDVLALARGIEKALKSPDEAMGRVLRAREEVGHRSWDARASSILTFASGIIQK